MSLPEKIYKFDELLTSLDIKYIDREIINKYYQEVRCDRCNAILVYVNILRIDAEYYNIGDFCYESIRRILSELRGKSLVHIKRELEDHYEEYLVRKYQDEDINAPEPKVNRYDPDYPIYESLKWDAEHGHLPDFKLQEFNELKKKFEE